MTTEQHIENLKAIASDMPSDKCADWIESLMAGVKALEALEQEPCEDVVSRQAVIDAIDKWVKSMHVLITLPANEVTPLFESVHELPLVTPQPKMGQWEWKPHPILPYTGNWYCSECNLIGQSVYSYCPNCGAKMQEVEE